MSIVIVTLSLLIALWFWCESRRQGRIAGDNFAQSNRHLNRAIDAELQLAKAAQDRDSYLSLFTQAQGDLLKQQSELDRLYDIVGKGNTDAGKDFARQHSQTEARLQEAQDLIESTAQPLIDFIGLDWSSLWMTDSADAVCEDLDHQD